MVPSQEQSANDEEPLPGWWQRTNTILLTVTGIVLVGLIALIAAGYWFAWPWVGLTAYTDPTGDYHPDKTLWDWLSLLFVPVVIGAATYWFRRTEQQIDRQRLNQQTKLEREAAKKRAETEQELAIDAQREMALQTYLNSMAELLLAKSLRASEEWAEVRIVARTLTLIVVAGLDGRRKGAVVRFLYEAGLINKDKPIVRLDRADLNEAKLDGIDLSGINLSRTNLSRADLGGTDLRGANLSHANLEEAELRWANLRSTDLDKAFLNGANLKGVMGVSTKQLGSAALLYDAIMPDGTKFANASSVDRNQAEPAAPSPSEDITARE